MAAGLDRHLELDVEVGVPGNRHDLGQLARQPTQSKALDLKPTTAQIMVENHFSANIYII